MRRNLFILLFVLSMSAIPQAGFASEDETLFALWTRANRLSEYGARSSEFEKTLDEMSAHCGKSRNRRSVEIMYVAECKRWIGERWIAIGRFDAAERELRDAYEFYGMALGSINPLSGEILTLLAEIYLKSGNWPAAGVAMDRALTLFPPIDPADIERCRAVYDVVESGSTRASCAAGLETHEIASKVERVQGVEYETKYLEFGELPLANGRLHRGFHRDGIRTGYGLEIGADRQEFWRGAYRRKSLNGRAVWVKLSDGRVDASYAGSWKDGWRHGYGTAVYESGNRYAGEFREGSPNGSGEYIWAITGAHYVGQIADSKFHGLGHLVIPGVLEYSGEWKDGEREGLGDEKFVGGLLHYRGRFVSGNPDGAGRLVIDQREIFSGEFHPKNGFGFGFLKTGEGEVFIGELSDGIPDGLGVRKDGFAFTTGVWNNGRRTRSWNEQDFEKFKVADGDE